MLKEDYEKKTDCISGSILTVEYERACSLLPGLRRRGIIIGYKYSIICGCGVVTEMQCDDEKSMDILIKEHIKDHLFPSKNLINRRK